MQLSSETGVTWLTMFTTSSTLVCCALPILLVSLGMGATVTAMTSNFPFLVTLSENKLWVFAFSALMLAVSGWLTHRSSRTCPTDPAKAAACARAQIWNKRVYTLSLVIWCIGFFAAFLALPIRIALDI